MRSVFSLGFLILALCTTASGRGVNGYRGWARQDGKTELTAAQAEWAHMQHYANGFLTSRKKSDFVSDDMAKKGVLQLDHLVDGAESIVLSGRLSGSGDAEEGEQTGESDEKSTTEGKDLSDSSAEDAKEETSDKAKEGGSADEDSETESPLDSMYIEIKKPGLGSHLTQPVFKERALSGLFNSCVIAPTDQGKENSSTSCYIDDAYNDRLTFDMTFRFPVAAIESEFERNPPSLQVIGDSSDIAEPSLLTTSINQASSTGEVSLAYGCKSTSSGTVALQMTLKFGDGEEDSIIIRWKKVCVNQENDKIELGILLNEKGKSDLTRQPFPSEKSPLIVEPSDVSTEVYVKLGQPGAQQVFLAPYITSSNPDVTPVTVRGNHPSGGVLQGLEQTLLQVSYDCGTKGVSDISLSIGIPPFENLTASWKKDCGGRTATSLQVGTSEESHDVVDNGNPTPRYMVAIENIGTAHSDEHLHLPGNQSDWTVYITNSETNSTPTASEAALHIGRITLTVEHPDTIAALSPKVSSHGMTGWSEQKDAEFIVAPGDSLQVSFHFPCRGLGESRILITVPVLQYDTLEFGIAKECTHIGTAHKARELVWTVGNVFWAGIFAFLLVISVWWWRRRRTMAKGFEALPVTER